MSGEVLLAMIEEEKMKCCLENQIALNEELTDFLETKFYMHIYQTKFIFRILFDFKDLFENK